MDTLYILSLFASPFVFLWNFILRLGKSLCVKKSTKREDRWTSYCWRNVHPTYDDFLLEMLLSFGKTLQRGRRQTLGLDANGKLARPCDSTIYFALLWTVADDDNIVTDIVRNRKRKQIGIIPRTGTRPTTVGLQPCLFRDPASSFIKGTYVHRYASRALSIDDPATRKSIELLSPVNSYSHSYIKSMQRR